MNAIRLLKECCDEAVDDYYDNYYNYRRDEVFDNVVDLAYELIELVESYEKIS